VLDSVSYPAPHDAVFVHGAGGNYLLWNRTLQHLAGPSKGVAVNLPGHPGGPITCHSVDDYAESLYKFILESGLSEPAVCGHSMGGAIALKLALMHPEAIGALILVSTGAKLGVDQALISGLRDDPMKAIERIITPWSFNSMDLGLGRESRTALSISNLPVFLNDYLACQGFDVRSRLPDVSARTMVICGDKDRMTPPRWSHFLAANIPGAEVYFIKDSGHMLPLEKPDALSRVVQSFLAAL
jgi:pimeloyl-ACP methyl ester carboxylesterase